MNIEALESEIDRLNAYRNGNADKAGTSEIPQGDFGTSGDHQIF